MYILGKELIVFNREIMEMENEYLVWCWYKGGAVYMFKDYFGC